jgi:hypothetical protein
MQHLAELLSGLLLTGGSIAQIVTAALLWWVVVDLRKLQSIVARHGLALRKLAVGKAVKLDDLEVPP